MCSASMCPKRAEARAGRDEDDVVGLAGNSLFVIHVGRLALLQQGAGRAPSRSVSGLFYE